MRGTTLLTLLKFRVLEQCNNTWQFILSRLQMVSENTRGKQGDWDNKDCASNISIHTFDFTPTDLTWFHSNLPISVYMFLFKRSMLLLSYYILQIIEESEQGAISTTLAYSKTHQPCLRPKPPVSSKRHKIWQHAAVADRTLTKLNSKIYFANH